MVKRLQRKGRGQRPVPNNPLTFTLTNANPTVTAVFASLGGTETNALTVIPRARCSGNTPTLPGSTRNITRAVQGRPRERRGEDPEGPPRTADLGRRFDAAGLAKGG